MDDLLDDDDDDDDDDPSIASSAMENNANLGVAKAKVEKDRALGNRRSSVARGYIPVVIYYCCLL
jgi:hypothetical protein